MFPLRDGARLQEELPDLWRERVHLIDDSMSEGGHALAELIQPDVGVDDGLQVRESLPVVFGARWGAAGANDVEEHLGSVLIAQAPMWSVLSFTSVALASTVASRPRKQRCGIRLGI